MEDFRSGKVIRGQAGSAGMMSMTSMMMGSRSGAEHIEGRLAYVKAELRITRVPARRRPPWQAGEGAGLFTKKKAASEAANRTFRGAWGDSRKRPAPIRLNRLFSPVCLKLNTRTKNFKDLPPGMAGGRH
jgi:hypothetical protein